MKGFYFDTVLDAENICNLRSEQRALWMAIEEKTKSVVYGRRNSGKTSVIKSIIIPKFHRKHKRSFVLFVDLMEVKSLASIHERIRLEFARAFAESFPGKQMLTAVKTFLRSLRPQIGVDELSGQPTLTFGVTPQTSTESFGEIFSVIRKDIARHVPILLVFDEFQDIALVGEAQGLMRQALQEFRGVPIITMGSKQHLLAEMFAKPNAPLAGFGVDIEFAPIPYREYFDYMRERFTPHGVDIAYDTAERLQQLLHRNPEAINMVCATLVAHYAKKVITDADILAAIDRTVEARRSRYETYLGQLSAREERLLTAMANAGTIRHPTGKAMLALVSVSPRGMKLIVDQLLNRSIIERSDCGYDISDPLLRRFLTRFRSPNA